MFLNSLRFPLLTTSALALALVTACAASSNDGKTFGSEDVAEGGAGTGAGADPGVGGDPAVGGDPNVGGIPAGGTPAVTPSWAKNGYPNLLVTALGKPEAEVSAKVTDFYTALFYGPNRVYFESPDGTAYMQQTDMDDGNRVTSEGISYGMMISAQMGDKGPFDKLWAFAKYKMRRTAPPLTGYYCWKTDTAGNCLDLNPAPDGELYMAMALFFASGRWGNGTGVNYREDADSILDACRAGGDGNTSALIDPATMRVVFNPIPGQKSLTASAYHLPAFLQAFSLFAARENQFWATAAGAARDYLAQVTHPTTGLAPFKTRIDGTPTNESIYNQDSARAIMNTGTDWVWWGTDARQPPMADNHLNFFLYVPVARDKFSLDGTKELSDYTVPDATLAMVATAAMSTTNPKSEASVYFLDQLYSRGMQAGQFRYYNGMMVMLSLLQLSGNFRVYAPQ